MSSSKRRSLRFVLAVVLLGAAGVNAKACEPTADGFACVSVACSPIPEDQCIATVLHLDISSGAITAVVCECMDFNDCHVEFGDATPRAVGNCPAGQNCQVFGEDTDRDGIEDQFGAECVSTSAGACCVDIDDGPIGYDTCMEVDQSSCDANGGIFHGANTACAEIQACCLSFLGKSFCGEMNPFCCFDSGGVPKGPGLTCVDIAAQGRCGEICGGFAGIPCGEGEFCKLRRGECCCDFQGFCTAIPTGCPDNWDPVCGCDGMTYGNECEADAAGVSTDRLGECESVCDESAGEPCVKVVVDMDSLRPGFQSNVDVPAGTSVVEDVAVYMFDPAEQHTIWGIGFVGLENRSIALGHMPASAENKGKVTGLDAAVGVPVNPGNNSWTVGSTGLLRAFAGPEVQYLEWGAQQPAIIPADPAGPLFTIDIMLDGAQPGDTFDFYLVDFAAVEGPGGAFCTQGPLSLDTGGDAVADGTQTLHGVDPDVPVEVPPGAFYVDFVDGGVQGPATITVLQPVGAIPAVSGWGLALTTLLLIATAATLIRRRTGADA